MRLIDADNVKQYILAEGLYCDTKADKEATAREIDKLFSTVDAIPIEWIEQWLDRVTGTKDGDDISKYHDLVKGGILFINMLERDWEKENGISQ